MIYFLLAGGTCLCALFANDCPLEARKKRNRRLYITAYGLLMALFFVILAFRDKNIGVDTTNYINKFFQINFYSSFTEYYSRFKIEPLFYFLNRALWLVDQTGISLLIAQAVVVVWGYNSCFSKFGRNRFVCLLAFLSLGLFAASLNLLRQTMAMAVCAYNISNAVDGKFKKFAVFSLVAAGIHFSAIFFIPTYFVCRFLKAGRKSGLLVMGVSVIMAVGIERLQALFSTVFSRWDHYADIEGGARGYVAFTIFLLITALAFVFQDEIAAEGKYATAVLNLNYVHMGIWVLRLFTRNAERVSFYYTIAPVLLIPLLFKAVGKRFGEKKELLFKILVIACLMAYFIYKTPSDRSYYPYAFWRN